MRHSRPIVDLALFQIAGFAGRSVGHYTALDAELAAVPSPLCLARRAYLVSIAAALLASAIALRIPRVGAAALPADVGGAMRLTESSS